MKKKFIAGVLAVTLAAGSIMPLNVAAEEAEKVTEQTEEETSEKKQETESEIKPESDTIEEQVPEIENAEEVQVNGASTIERSGSCGDNATYTLDSDGELIISGSGEIEDEAFYGKDWCKEEISKVVISNGITSVGDSAFKGNDLSSIVISLSVTSIGAEAFRDCEWLREINIPSSVTSIGAEAFRDCGLYNISIPSNVTSIGNCAFSGCNLYTITVDKNNPKYDSRENCNAIIEKSTNCLIVGSYNTEIPTSVTSIGAEAFRECDLDSISISSNVTSIGNCAFSGCNLYTITVDKNNPKYDSRENCNAIIEKSTNCLIVGSSNTKIPTSVISISAEAFRGRALRGIIIPSNVTSIGDSTFDSCSYLEYIIFPKTQITIGRDVLSGTSNLKKIYGYSSTKIKNVEDSWYSYTETLEEWTGDRYNTQYVSLDNGIQLILIANGGSVSDATRFVYPANPYGELPTPTRTGYSFTGWYTAASGGTKINSNDTVQSLANQNLWRDFLNFPYFSRLTAS